MACPRLSLCFHGPCPLARVWDRTETRLWTQRSEEQMEGASTGIHIVVWAQKALLGVTPGEAEPASQAQRALPPKPNILCFYS